jgi:alanyl-tRNA synthetase
MMGNFSFGDYFKERAIELAWTLCTKTFDLPKDKLLVTVYHTDDEAFDLWKKIAGLPDSRIIRIPTSDNFWAMGDTGPCGPCSEIFFDQGDKLQGGPPGSPDQDGDRFLEFWNLVFMQYEQVTPSERVNLPRPSIDTGMGLERMSAILQGVPSNYDTDLFRGLIRASVDAIGVDAEGPRRPSHRVIADHLRASAFLVADGVLPSNEGRGYVLRRIMRRAMRHAELLGAKDPVMFKLVPALVREMGPAYPELTQSEPLIAETLKLEETRFRKTLVKGLQILDEESSKLKKGDTLSGDVAFKLHDTYGFPLDLTQDALRAREILVDTAAFETAMDKQRSDARASWSGSGDAATETVWFAVRERAGASEFLGYDTETAEGVVTAVVKDGKEVPALKTGEQGFVVLNQTPFYAESGGQQGDRGEMTGAGVVLTVTDTQKRADGLVVHNVTVKKGEVAQGAALELKVDHARRTGIRANHSATHLLHEALRRVLGDHVAQKGSLVAPDRLRFDFSHPKGIAEEDLAKIEDISNAQVLANAPIETRLMAVDDAIASGARALFGEKYGDEVRVVSMGAREGNKVFSVELCGGTHAVRTGDIGLVAVLGESGVSAGVRRVEALTGDAARKYLADRGRMLDEVAAHLKVPPADAVARVAALVDERRKLERELTEARKQIALGGGGGDGESAAEAKDVGGVKFLGRVLKGIPAKDLKGMVDDAKKKLGSGVISFIAVDDENKASIVVGVTEDQVASNNAVDLVRAGAEALGGKGGGGRPDMAQAGGPDGSKADAALAAVAAQLRAG